MSNGNMLDTSDLNNYGLSTRVLNRLAAGGYRTAAQVRAAADLELLDIREFGETCLRQVRDKIGRDQITTDMPLPRRWYPREDDTIGGWCLMTADQPPSMADWRRGELQVGSFLGEEVARHVAELHNTWLATEAAEPRTPEATPTSPEGDREHHQGRARRTAVPDPATLQGAARRRRTAQGRTRRRTGITDRGEVRRRRQGVVRRHVPDR